MENVWGRWGNVSFETGGLSPAVFNSTMPVDPAANGELCCTNFMPVQPLSEQFIVTAGKTRTIGVADNNKFAGGDGSDQFINQTFVANPLMVPQIPLSTFVVGAAMPQEWGNISRSDQRRWGRGRRYSTEHETVGSPESILRLHTRRLSHERPCVLELPPMPR